jgi:ATP-dependent 26S proteasome regulatory subunit
MTSEPALGALALLDEVLSAALAEARPTLGEVDANPFRGLYVRQEDALRHAQAAPAGRSVWMAGHDAPRGAARPGAPLAAVGLLAALEPFDRDVIALALAPEVDLGYERIYAYLQDDAARRRPTVALALDLFASSRPERLAMLARFEGDAPLAARRLVAVGGGAEEPDAPLLGRTIALDDQIVRHLLARRALDRRIAGFSRLHAAGGGPRRLVAADRALVPLARRAARGRAHAVLALAAPERRDRLRLARDIAAAAGLPLLDADLAVAPDDPAESAAVLAREARLWDAALLLDGADALVAFVLDTIGPGGPLTFAPESAVRLASVPALEVPHVIPDARTRRVAWARAARAAGATPARRELDALASRFRLTLAQVDDAVGVAGLRALAGGRSRPAAEDLFDAARIEAGRALAGMAQRIQAAYRWDDIVLHEDHRRQLEEICDHVRHRDRVFGDMGFATRMPLGSGLSVLFSGPPGTGKTMAAGVLARELGLELYRIDLSQVVSKYIGETEKALERIFAAAETADAILFFDEADAIFGRRSEVKDAHDRFANIEVAYLLQRMEAYDGVTVLATNLRHNVDPAFLRRLRFVVEFPNPDEALRLDIWRHVWPERAELAADVDLPRLARFELAGGHIRNIALGAAFLSARDSGPIAMRHIMAAARREHQKGGQMVAADRFEAAA